MIDRIQEHLDIIRLSVRQRGLRRREQMALARLGQVTLADGGSRAGRLATLAVDAAMSRTRLAALEEERQTALAASRADLAAAPRWKAPVVLVRGASARVVLRQRRAAMERAMHQLHLIAGRLAMAGPPASAAARQVQAIRTKLAGIASEQERRKAELEARPLPAWMERARTEGKHLGGALWSQLRSQLTPKAPALAGMAMGWWIASRYTDSHAKSILRSVGIGHGGTHVVSGSMFKAMHFGLPLLAAAVCAYVGARIAAAVQEGRAAAPATALEVPVSRPRR
jgi:hypothetical protein